MLAISLEPSEYVTINGNIVVKVDKMTQRRCFLAIEADKSIPIVRGEVLERGGGQRPACVDLPVPAKKAKYRPGAAFRWNDDREKAVRTLQKVADLLEKGGSGDAAKILRLQLDRIIPQVWEDELPLRSAN